MRVCAGFELSTILLQTDVTVKSSVVFRGVHFIGAHRSDSDHESRSRAILFFLVLFSRAAIPIRMSALTLYMWFAECRFCVTLEAPIHFLRHCQVNNIHFRASKSSTASGVVKKGALAFDTNWPHWPIVRHCELQGTSSLRDVNGLLVRVFTAVRR